MSKIHICTIETPKTYLPYNKNDKKIKHVLCNILIDLILVWKKHPLFTWYYRSNSAYLDERKLHVNSKYYYLIHPLSKICFVADMIFLTAYPISFIYFPFICIEDLFDFGWIVYPMESFLTITFIMEIILRCFLIRIRMHYDDTVFDHRVIMTSYLFSFMFICDLFGAIPLIIIKHLTNNIILLNTLMLLRYFKFFRLKHFISYLQKFFEASHLNKYRNYSSFFLIIPFFSYWLNCLNYHVKNFGKKHDHSHTTIDFIVNSWETTGMFLSAKRVKELYDIPLERRIICCTTILLGRITVLIVGVIFVYQQLQNNRTTTNYREMIGQVGRYMHQKNLPKKTQERILSLYEYKFNEKYLKESKILEIFSDNLRKEVNYHTTNKVFGRVKIFQDIPQKIVNEILFDLIIEIYLEDDIIVKAGFPSDGLYFLSSGTVSVSTISGREVCHLYDGSYFGEASLLLKNKKSSSTITAIETCEIYKLKGKNFKQHFKGNPEILTRLKREAESNEEKMALFEREFKENLFVKTYSAYRKETIESQTSVAQTTQDYYSFDVY